MPASTIISSYVGRGPHSARPSTPPIGPESTAIYFETDTNLTFIWSGSAWVDISSGGEDIDPVYAPLVTGALPGPDFVPDGDGQCIMVPT